MVMKLSYEAQKMVTYVMWQQHLKLLPTKYVHNE